MTNGNIIKHILNYSIPLLIGNIFQLLYNTVDSLVVGRYVGQTALASVGASSPIINLLVSFFTGLSVGASILIARYFGAKDENKLRESTHTFIVFSFLSGIFLTIVGCLLAKDILEFMQTPTEVLELSSNYLIIYFLGSIPFCLYNGGSSILRAIGDSKSPLYFLILSSIINITLDLVFVNVFHLGVIGVGLATLVAQIICSILILLLLFHSNEIYSLRIKELKMNMKALKDMIVLGVPAALQGTVVSYSNVIVQSYINRFGSYAMAGFSSSSKIDSFIAMPINSFSLAVTTFVAQNLGVQKYERAKKGIQYSVWMSFLTVVVIGVTVFWQAPFFISLFSKDSQVVASGTLFLRAMAPFYLLLTFTQVYSGALRAMGKTLTPMVISIGCFVVVRQIFLMVTMPIFNDAILVGYAYGFTWALSAVITLIYYHFNKLKVL